MSASPPHPAGAPDTPQEARDALRGAGAPVGVRIAQDGAEADVKVSDWHVFESGRVELSIEGRDDHVTVNIERELLEVK